MNPPLAIATLLLVAAATPGPNTLVVLRTAAAAGFARALPAIGGIVLGGLALLALVVAGPGAALGEWPALRMPIAAGGALYLAWLGLRLVRAGSSGRGQSALPAGVGGLFVFQFLNPKGWLMLLTAVAASPAHGALATFTGLAPLVAGIPAICLLLWAALGRLLARWLDRPGVRRWTDRVLGALLLASAVPLLA